MIFAAYQITVSLGMQDLAHKQAMTAADQAKIAANQAEQCALESRSLASINKGETR